MDTHETRAKSTFLFESAVARRSIIDKADVRMCHTTMQRCSSSSRGARHLPESVPSSSTPLAEHVEQKKLLRSCSSTNNARIHAPLVVSSARSHTRHDAPCVGCVKRRVPILFFGSLWTDHPNLRIIRRGVSPALGVRSAGWVVTGRCRWSLSRQFQAPDLLHRFPAATAIEGARVFIARGDVQLHALCFPRGGPKPGLVHQTPGQARATR